jgi:hypothetical protein
VVEVQLISRLKGKKRQDDNLAFQGGEIRFQKLLLLLQVGVILDTDWIIDL